MVLGEVATDPVAVAAAVLRASGAFLVIVEGWWWCFVLGLRMHLLLAIALTALLAAIGTLLGELCFRVMTAAGL